MGEASRRLRQAAERFWAIIKAHRNYSIGAGVVWLLEESAKHGFFAWFNHHLEPIVLDAMSAALLAPEWLAGNPLGITGLLIALVLLGLFVHAYFETRPAPAVESAQMYNDDELVNIRPVDVSREEREEENDGLEEEEPFQQIERLKGLFPDPLRFVNGAHSAIMFAQMVPTYREWVKRSRQLIAEHFSNDLEDFDSLPRPPDLGSSYSGVQNGRLAKSAQMHVGFLQAMIVRYQRKI
jgi:hypothetical protein